MLYFDVHGTLFVYDYNLYKSVPAWFDEGVHPFAKDKPLFNMPRVIAQLIERKAELCTLCRINKGTLCAQEEQRNDVRNNLIKYYPALSENSQHFCTGAKSLFISDKGVSLRKSDILLDDYQPNLIEWEKAGGTSIKVLNGVNSLTTWQGLFIDSRALPESTVRYLLEVSNRF